MIRIEARERVLSLHLGVASIIASLAALALCAVLFAVAGTTIHRGFELMLAGTFGSQAALAATLARTALLSLTGLAAAIAFRIRLWNLGAEGQLQAGVWVAFALSAGTSAMPAILAIPVVLVAGALAGALVMLVPVLLKVYRGIDEAMVTLLFNVLLMTFAAMWSGPSQSNVVTTARMPMIPGLDGADAGIVIALVAVIVVAVAMRFTVWGFKMRAIAGNAAAARFAGINVERVTLGVGLISGACAGLAGAMALASDAGNVTPVLGAGLGYAGIAVAVLAGRSLIAVLPAALFVAALQVGTDAVQKADAAPMHSGDIVVAGVLLFALVAHMAARYRIRRRHAQRSAA